MTTATATRNLPFDNGDKLSRAEFHRLYSDCEELEHVELIEGVVYLPSPIHFRGHTREQTRVIVWLDTYASRRPGLMAGSPASILLDDDNEPEPDAVLFREREDTYQDDYLAVAPELIVEIAASSASRDLHQKKTAYERNGVREYVVWRTRDNAIGWLPDATRQWRRTRGGSSRARSSRGCGWTCRPCWRRTANGSWQRSVASGGSGGRR